MDGINLSAIRSALRLSLLAILGGVLLPPPTSALFAQFAQRPDAAPDKARSAEVAARNETTDVVLVHLCAVLAEGAKDRGWSAVAELLCRSGLVLLNPGHSPEPIRDSRAANSKDRRRLELEVRLRLVRAACLAGRVPSGPEWDWDVVSRAVADYRWCTEKLAVLANPFPEDTAVGHLRAEAEFGLAQLEPDPVRAARHCQRVLRLLAERKDVQAVQMRATIYQRLVMLSLDELSRPGLVMPLLARVSPLWRRSLRSHLTTSIVLAQWHYGVGRVYWLLSQTDQALLHLDLAIQLANRYPNSPVGRLCRARTYHLLYQLAKTSNATMVRAANYLNRALAEYRQLPPHVCPHLEEAVIHRQLAEELFLEQRHEDGFRHLRRAFGLLKDRENRPPGGPALVAKEQILCYLARGQAQQQIRNDRSQAEQDFRQAWKVAQGLTQSDTAARWLRLLCATRLAEHLAEHERAAEAQAILTTLLPSPTDAARVNPEHLDAPAVSRSDTWQTVEPGLYLPLARAYHLAAQIQAKRDKAPDATSFFQEACRYYRAALKEGSGEPADLGACYLDLARWSLTEPSEASQAKRAKDYWHQAVQVLTDAAPQKLDCWLPLSSAHLDLAALVADEGGPLPVVTDHLDKAVWAARQAVRADQPFAESQLAAALQERGLWALHCGDPLDPPLPYLQEAAARFQAAQQSTTGSEPLAPRPDAGTDPLWSQLTLYRTLAELEWEAGQSPAAVWARCQQAQEILDQLHPSTSAALVEAARLERLRAQVLQWICSTESSSGSDTIVLANRESSPDTETGSARSSRETEPLPSNSSMSPAPSGRPTATDVIQAYRAAIDYYRDADQQGEAPIDEWDVALFNLADFYESYLGDAHEALRCYKEELALQDRFPAPDWVRQTNRSLILARMALVHSRLLADPDQAGQLYREANQRLQATRQNPESPDRLTETEIELLVRAELTLGVLSAQIPEHEDRALGHFSQALQWLEAVEDRTGHWMAFEYWARRGRVQQWLRQGAPAPAAEDLKRVLELAERLGFEHPEEDQKLLRTLRQQLGLSGARPTSNS